MNIGRPFQILSCLLFHFYVPPLPHPLMCVLCSFSQNCLFHAYIIQSHISEPLFLFLEYFPFASWQTPLRPQGPAQMVYTRCKKSIPDFLGQQMVWFCVFFRIQFCCNPFILLNIYLHAYLLHIPLIRISAYEKATSLYSHHIVFLNIAKI